jgi:hypothetical protein
MRNAALVEAKNLVRRFQSESKPMIEAYKPEIAIRNRLILSTVL